MSLFFKLPTVLALTHHPGYRYPMALTFNSILEEIGVDPGDVRMLRHTPDVYFGRTLYALWRDGHPDFLTYQSIQVVRKRGNLNASYWASFLVTPARSVMFVGLFKVKLAGSCPQGAVDPVTRDDIGGADRYDQELIERSVAYVGRVFINWGNFAITWVQRADKQPKPILEIARVFQNKPTQAMGRSSVTCPQSHRCQ